MLSHIKKAKKLLESGSSINTDIRVKAAIKKGEMVLESIEKMLAKKHYWIAVYIDKSEYGVSDDIAACY